MTLSSALNEAITLNQKAANELVREDDDFLSEERSEIKNDIAAAAFAADMAKLESDVAIRERLEEQAVYMLSVASEKIRKVRLKSDHFYEMAELNASIYFSNADFILFLAGFFVLLLLRLFDLTKLYNCRRIARHNA
jgi:hypothetical protein